MRAARFDSSLFYRQDRPETPAVKVIPEAWFYVLLVMTKANRFDPATSIKWMKVDREQIGVAVMGVYNLHHFPFFEDETRRDTWQE